MADNPYIMPTSPPLDDAGNFRPEWLRYLSGIQAKQAEYVDPSTATAQTVAQSLIDSRQMKDG